MHARHRVLNTPGPTGWNDHGDPCHIRRTGPTPGSLSVNDHGTPLAEPLPLLSPALEQEITTRINGLIEEADSAAHRRTEEKLQACLDAVEKRESTDQSQDDAARCTAAYFRARLLALEGKCALTEEEVGPERDTAQTGGLEYRARGSFFRPLGNYRLWETRLDLSYRRIGQSSPGRNTRFAARDGTADWVERGIADGLRDRSEVAGKLRRYVSR
jgi:hypothetical protein